MSSSVRLFAAAIDDPGLTKKAGRSRKCARSPLSALFSASEIKSS